MQGISIFKQTYAAGASRVVMGFDSAVNTYSPYAIGCIVGKSYAMAAAVVNEDSDQWHIVNLNTKHGFDAVAVLGAIDEDEAASIAMRDFGRFKESAMWDSVIATNTGGLKRYIDSPLCVRGRKVFNGEIGAMQDMAAGQKILWDGIDLQSHQGSIRVLLSDMVQHDDESALVEKFDGLSAWLAESDVEVVEFDALVVENYRLEQTMAKLASAMGAASGQGGVSVTNVTQTKAVKLRNSGAIQVGVSFELSDGQAVTAIFNHADSETQKLGLKDTLFSWKWKLNSRDISAAVQPNNFENVKLDILAGRIMKLVNANSARFQRSQAKKLENEQALADGNARIAEKKATIESLKSEIESLHGQIEEQAKEQANVQKDDVGAEAKDGGGDGEPIVLTGKELGDFPDTDEGKKALRKAAIGALTELKGQWIDCPALDGIEGNNVKVEIRKRGIKEFKAFSGDTRKLKLAAAIKDIVKSAKLESPKLDENHKKDKKAEIIGYYHLTANVILDGEVFKARVVVEKDNRGLLHYDLILPKSKVGIFDSAKQITAENLITIQGQPLDIDIAKNSEISNTFDSIEIENPIEKLTPDTKSGGLNEVYTDMLENNQDIVNTFDAVGDKYVLNLFIQVKDEHGNWVDLDDEDDFKAESEAADDDLSMETKISKQDQGVDMSIDANSNVEKTVAPLPQEIDIVNLEKMGVVQITEQGDENIYFVKDGREYYAKVQNTEDYPVGEFDLGQYPQGLPRTSAVDHAPDTEEAPMLATNPDAEYLQAIIDGTADLSVAGDELERIGDNLPPELEELFEQAAEAYAQYAISLEV